LRKPRYKRFNNFKYCSNGISQETSHTKRIDQSFSLEINQKHP